MSFKTTIALVLIFALLMGVYFFAFRNRSKSDEQETDTISKAYGIEKSGVTKIDLEFKDRSLEPFSLVRDDDGNWRFIKPIHATNLEAVGEKPGGNISVTSVV